tara:strand:+ start:775 stop:1089 length:315 start_codon:yes stop_codon:yes gene_type:complete
MRDKKRVREGYGIIGGMEGFDVGSCPGAPDVRLFLIGKNLHYVHKEHLVSPNRFVIGQPVHCNVWELLSIIDHEGIVVNIDGEFCIVRFKSGTKRIHQRGLEPR